MGSYDEVSIDELGDGHALWHGLPAATCGGMRVYGARVRECGG